MSIGAKPLLAVRHRPFALAGLVSLALCAMTSVAQLPSTPTDLQVKAAYLYKFAAFVQWPNGAPRDSFAICVLGRDPFGATLDATLTGGTIEGKPLEPLRISNPQDAARCQIVFISSSEEPRLKALLQIVDRMPVLTVSDMDHFVDRGGMIQFVLDNGRVRFDVNLDSAQKAGLGLSSQLLKVALTVKRQGDGN